LALALAVVVVAAVVREVARAGKREVARAVFVLVARAVERAVARAVRMVVGVAGGGSGMALVVVWRVAVARVRAVALAVVVHYLLSFK
jgi:hypothetical protein